ncbi:MAG: hypothetical protein A2199_04985 [Hydrogenophilales bacterium RIFOXYA1_FULL_63_33]|nr:MAG: hypothetical protein A2199_04985 [Hydrogenophilales bacterium RIFOXYA1_FULL_63_33]
MANITADNVNNKFNFGGVPYGNLSVIGPFNLTVDANGVFTDSNDATQVVQTDIIRLGVLKAGMKLYDYLSYISDAFTAQVTVKVGFAYVDGVDSTAVPQDDDFFATALAMDSAVTARKTTSTKPVTLPKDAYLILTIAGADCAAVGVQDIYVLAEMGGQP